MKKESTERLFSASKIVAAEDDVREIRFWTASEMKGAGNVICRDNWTKRWLLVVALSVVLSLPLTSSSPAQSAAESGVVHSETSTPMSSTVIQFSSSVHAIGDKESYTTSETVRVSETRPTSDNLLHSGNFPNSPTGLTTDDRESPVTQETVAVLDSTDTDTSSVVSSTATSTAGRGDPSSAGSTLEVTTTVGLTPCGSGPPCVHGTCFAGVMCHCDPEWTGQSCEQPCPLGCSPSGICLSGPLAAAICVCKDASVYVPGEGCIATEDSGQPLPSTTAAVGRTSPSPNMPTTLRPVEDRTCFPGFVCEHGFCSRETFMALCVCDDSWEGPWCKQKVPPSPTAHDAPTKPSLNGTERPDELFEWSEIDGIPLMPLRYRACLHNYVCRYGNCSSNGLGCDCERNFVGHFCEEKCPVSCFGNNSRCEEKTDNVTGTTWYICACEQGFTGDNCTQIFVATSEDDGDFEWLAVAVFVGMLAVVMVTTAALLYWLWRRRNITVMKFVFWFQRYEDDDGREYDAFVSYASADQDLHFVRHRVVPHLEGQLNFSLCIHHRDFRPGSYISDGITESIKKSRRTLLVISPAFIDSLWCKFEYQFALQEMLAQRNRILPVIIHDAPSELKEKMDDTLKSIVGSLTYLEYPGECASEKAHELFWKRLALSMPKKRPAKVYQTQLSSSSQVPLSPYEAENSPSRSSSLPQLSLGRPEGAIEDASPAVVPREEVAESSQKMWHGQHVDSGVRSDTARNIFGRIFSKRTPKANPHENGNGARLRGPTTTSTFNNSSLCQKDSKTFTNFGFDGDLKQDSSSAIKEAPLSLLNSNHTDNSTLKVPVAKDADGLINIDDNFLVIECLQTDIAQSIT